MPKTYNCGAVNITRNDQRILLKDRRRCFAYVEDNRCSALTEMLCKTKGKCPFWKEGSNENSDMRS